MGSVANAVHRDPWNKGKIVGHKAPFRVQLRGCDLVAPGYETSAMATRSLLAPS